MQFCMHCFKFCFLSGGCKNFMWNTKQMKIKDLSNRQDLIKRLSYSNHRFATNDLNPFAIAEEQRMMSSKRDKIHGSMNRGHDTVSHGINVTYYLGLTGNKGTSLGKLMTPLFLLSNIHDCNSNLNFPKKSPNFE